LHQDIQELPKKTAPAVEARKKRIAELTARLAENPRDRAARKELADERKKKARPSGGPYPANRTLALVSKMWNLAATWGVVPDGYGNPARGIDHFRETKRDRWVTAAELPKLAKAIDAEENVYVRAALWLYLFTGMRRNELLTAKWEYFDKDRRELRLPETKAGRPFVVPLSGPAMVILDNLPRLKGNPYILPSLKVRREGEPPKHLGDISHRWIEVRTAAGVGDVHLHDLRRTVGSWLAMDGASLLVIGKTLNQTSPATTQVYARLSEDPVRAALERHAKRVVAVAKGKLGGKVIKYPGRRAKER
jgi:integrase